MTSSTRSALLATATLSVVVLGGVYPAEYERVVAARLAAVVWDVATAEALAATARAAGRVVGVHVKVDTGMSRLGCAPAEAPELLAALQRQGGVTVEGLLTHFTNAETVEGVETRRHLAAFSELVGEHEARGLRPQLVHAANSAATSTS